MHCSTTKGERGIQATISPSGATTKAELKMDENGWEIELYLLRLCVRLVKVVENLVLVENSKLLNGGEKIFQD